MSANEKWLARKADPKYRAYMKEYLRKYMRGVTHAIRKDKYGEEDCEGTGSADDGR